MAMKLGQSFASAAPVRFDVYRLRRNSDGIAGRSPYYFALDRTIRLTRPYRDVDDAFAKEIGLGTRGLLTWSGPR